MKAAAAERSLVEANMKVDGLETEVAALKTLVLTSTPARPNRHRMHSKNDSRCQCYQNFFGRNVLVFVISYRVFVQGSITEGEGSVWLTSLN